MSRRVRSPIVREGKIVSHRFTRINVDHKRALTVCYLRKSAFICGWILSEVALPRGRACDTYSPPFLCPIRLNDY